MKKINIHFIFLLALTAIVGCTNSEYDLSPIIESAKVNTTRISQDSAIENLLQVMEFRSSQTKSSELQIKNVYSVGSSDFNAATRSDTDITVDSLLYIVNFENDEGFAVVAADTRVPADVLAIVDEGNASPSDFTDITSEEDFPFYLISSYAFTGLTDSTEIFEPSVDLDTNIGSIPAEYVESYWVSEIYLTGIIETMLTSRWSQWTPFNDFQSSNFPAGCVPIAAAQIFAYNAYPSTISYEGRELDLTKIRDYESPYTIEEKADLSAFVKFVSKDMNVDYGASGSDSKAKHVKSFFSEYYNNVNKYTGYQEDLILDMLNAGRPVYIDCERGFFVSGHAWVIDGKFILNDILKRYECGTDKLLGRYGTYTTYLHCNWGWGGQNNGYYESGMLYWEKEPAYSDSGTETSSADYDGDAWAWRTVTYEIPQ